MLVKKGIKKSGSNFESHGGKSQFGDEQSHTYFQQGPSLVYILTSSSIEKFYLVTFSSCVHDQGILVFASVMATLGLLIIYESGRRLISQASTSALISLTNMCHPCVCEGLGEK